MSKDRILGSAVTLELYKPDGSVLSLEVDSFDKEQKHELKQWHPLGQVGETNQVIYKGWDLTFKVGKTDDAVSVFFDTLDQALLSGQSAPKIRVVETIKHFDGNNEVWIFPDATLYNYKHASDNAEDEIKEDFKGVCRKRVKGY